MKRGAFRTTLEFRFKNVLIALAFLAPTSRAMTGWAQTVRSQFPLLQLRSDASYGLEQQICGTLLNLNGRVRSRQPHPTFQGTSIPGCRARCR